MFVLAHLSDPHLGPVPLPRFAELSGKRGLGFLNWLRSRRLRHRPEVLDLIVSTVHEAFGLRTVALVLPVETGLEVVASVGEPVSAAELRPRLSSTANLSA